MGECIDLGIKNIQYSVIMVLISIWPVIIFLPLSFFPSLLMFGAIFFIPVYFVYILFILFKLYFVQQIFLLRDISVLQAFKIAKQTPIQWNVILQFSAFLILLELSLSILWVFPEVLQLLIYFPLLLLGGTFLMVTMCNVYRKIDHKFVKNV